MSVKDATPKLRRDLPREVDGTQLEKFKQAAREFEADDSEEAFDRVLRKVSKATHSLGESKKLSQRAKPRP